MTLSWTRSPDDSATDPTEGNACAVRSCTSTTVLELPPRSSAVLEKVGFELVHIRDPREVEGRLRREPPALVLIEVLLEDCDGFELIERIVSAPNAAGVPIVVVTRGERSPELYGRSLELGVRDFLCKPVLETQVLGAVLEFAQQAPAAAKRPREPEPAEAAESGDLATRPVPELFARLHRIGASGTLRLEAGRGHSRGAVPQRLAGRRERAEAQGDVRGVRPSHRLDQAGAVRDRARASARRPVRSARGARGDGSAVREPGRAGGAGAGPGGAPRSVSLGRGQLRVPAAANASPRPRAWRSTGIRPSHCSRACAAPARREWCGPRSRHAARPAPSPGRISTARSISPKRPRSSARSWPRWLASARSRKRSPPRSSIRACSTGSCCWAPWSSTKRRSSS